MTSAQAKWMQDRGRRRGAGRGEGRTSVSLSAYVPKSQSSGTSVSPVQGTAGGRLGHPAHYTWPPALTALPEIPAAGCCGWPVRQTCSTRCAGGRGPRPQTWPGSGSGRQQSPGTVCRSAALARLARIDSPADFDERAGQSSLSKGIPASPSNITREYPHSLLILQRNTLIAF